MSRIRLDAPEKIDKRLYSMYDRTLKPIPERPTIGLRYRVETLLGITGLKLAKHRISWSNAIMSQFRVVWRPHVLPVLIFEVSISLQRLVISRRHPLMRAHHWQGILFGFCIGISVRNISSSRRRYGQENR